MKESIIKKMEMVRGSFFFVYKNNKRYQHSVTLNGWLFLKPNIETLNINGKRVARFILYQVYKNRVESYPCQTFVESIIDRLALVENVCLINCLGKLSFSQYTTLVVHIEELQVTHEFQNEPLDPPYKKKER